MLFYLDHFLQQVELIAQHNEQCMIKFVPLFFLVKFLVLVNIVLNFQQLMLRLLVELNLNYVWIVWIYIINPKLELL